MESWNCGAPGWLCVKSQEKRFPHRKFRSEREKQHNSHFSGVYYYRKNCTRPKPMRSIPESGSAAFPARRSTGLSPRRLPEYRKSTEQTKAATAVGKSARPARLALKPALRLFRDKVRLKVNISGSRRQDAGGLMRDGGLSAASQSA